MQSYLLAVGEANLKISMSLFDFLNDVLYLESNNLSDAESEDESVSFLESILPTDPVNSSDNKSAIASSCKDYISDREHDSSNTSSSIHSIQDLGKCPVCNFIGPANTSCIHCPLPSNSIYLPNPDDPVQLPTFHIGTCPSCQERGQIHEQCQSCLAYDKINWFLPSQDSSSSIADDDISDTPLDNIGSCPSCESQGPVGLFCSNCEDMNMIFSDCRITDDSLPCPKVMAVASFNKSKIGNLNHPSTFTNARMWFDVIPPNLFSVLSTNVHCHWDGGSNSHIFTSKEFFYVLQPASGVITQVSGSSASVEGLGIVFMRVPKSDIIIPLYPCYYAPTFPQHTLSPPAIKHYNNYRSVRTEALSWVRLVSETGK